SDIDILFLCNPNNPTGHTIPPELMERISAKCRETGTFLVVDECFLDFVEGGRERSARQFLSDNSAILKAFTKIYAMPGIRLGYALFGSSEAAEKAASTGQAWSVSTPAQAAGIAALRLDGYVEKTVEVISTEREFIQNGLRSLGLEYVPSEANFILFRRGLPLDELLSQRGIALRNCENYDGLEPGWFRTAVRLREENALLLAALREVLNG
ncbi:MAG: pyridoxal phosphate-dependent aminotransferase, partial [Eggerthellaceae bacterium]